MKRIILNFLIVVTIATSCTKEQMNPATSQNLIYIANVQGTSSVIDNITVDGSTVTLSGSSKFPIVGGDTIIAGSNVDGDLLSVIKVYIHASQGEVIRFTDTDGKITDIVFDKTEDTSVSLLMTITYGTQVPSVIVYVQGTFPLYIPKGEQIH